MTTTADTTRIEQQVSVHFEDVRLTLARLARENETLVFDYETPDGEKGARSQIFKLKKINAAIDKKHKQVKADVLAQSKMIDSVKRELKASVAEMIAVHQKPLDEIVQRELDRQQEIEIAFREFRKVPEHIGMNTLHKRALELLDVLLEIQITKEKFQERYDEAVEEYNKILEHVEATVRTLKENEERDRELAELKAKQAEHERKERERKIAEEAAAKAKADAEFKAASERKAIEEESAQREAQRIAELNAERAELNAKQKKAGTEKRRLLTMFADWIVEEYLISPLATGDQLIEKFFAKHPNLK